MVARYSHKAADESSASFHDETNRAIRLLRQASERCGRSPGEDLATNQRKRKQRGLLEQAIQAIELAQRKGMDADAGAKEFPVLTKITLREAVKKMGSVNDVATHFGMSTGAIKRSMRMFSVQPDDYGEFFGESGGSKE